MERTNPSTGTTCRSIFQGSLDAEKYTKLWVTLINKMERGKQILSATR